jgi:hypothetical protein
VFDHRIEHCGVPVRDDIAVVATLAEAFDSFTHVVEDVQFVVDGQDLVALFGSDVDAAGIESVLEGVAVDLVKRLVGVELVCDDGVGQRAGAPKLRDWLGLVYAGGEGGGPDDRAEADTAEADRADDRQRAKKQLVVPVAFITSNAFVYLFVCCLVSTHECSSSVDD